eukprot:3767355-Prymnesium_polylepis.2
MRERGHAPGPNPAAARHEIHTSQLERGAGGITLIVLSMCGHDNMHACHARQWGGQWCAHNKPRSGFFLALCIRSSHEQGGALQPGT